MRKGFTLVECMLAGSILSIAALGLLQGLGVLSRVAAENAEMLEADAIVWDALATEFNRPYNDLKIHNHRSTYTYEEDERTLTKEKAPSLHMDMSPAVLGVHVDGVRIGGREVCKTITAWVNWGLPEDRKGVTNFVYRSNIQRGKDGT